MRKERHREIEEYTQGSIVGKWENWDGTSLVSDPCSGIPGEQQLLWEVMTILANPGTGGLEEAGQKSSRRRIGANKGQGSFQTGQGV